ncbi:MAG: hypothetical protein AAGM46_13650 [Cyanobacteria bacterium J06582_2]
MSAIELTQNPVDPVDPIDHSDRFTPGDRFFVKTIRQTTWSRFSLSLQSLNYQFITNITVFTDDRSLIRTYEQLS